MYNSIAISTSKRKLPNDLMDYSKVSFISQQHSKHQSKVYSNVRYFLEPKLIYIN